MSEMKGEMGQLKEQNEKMKEQIARMNAEFAEKIAELNANADKLMLANLIENYDRINGQQLPPKFDSSELKRNKMDLADSASKLSFAMNELDVTSYHNGWRCLRALLPVPEFNRNAKEPYIAFYFEGHINKTLNQWWGGVGIGLCSLQFPLEGDFVGKHRNSIGFTRRQGLDNCGGWTHFQEVHDPFKVGDKIGLGLMYEPKNASIKCFAIWNRKLLGSAILPAKFFDVKIYPVVSLADSGNSIHLNFGNEEWNFDPRQLIQ